MATAAPARFYITGGTLPAGTPSYVERQADRELYEGLSRGEFCYVLHARQMGKSSLMAHATARLREAGIAVVNLDLTRLGQNLSVEQWYDGLLGHLGRQLDLEDELEEYWLEHERLSPLQRWLGALHEVVLARVPGRLVIAVDEIDAVRSLPFSTDEFFAAIRDCYNRRSQDPEFARLTFCLLGVATPSDLIQDTRTTPFNIGRRIELTDFTAAEALPLIRGLGRDPAQGNSLLSRVLYWTGGHPYLTQRLCQIVAADTTGGAPESVDRHCEALFFSAHARERDDNLIFVRERLLNSEADRAAILDLYARVRRGQWVEDEEANPLVGFLRLSGIVRSLNGRLVVRNRIYERVFDLGWTTQSMPDAELRRQRAAFRRGVLRTATVAAVILLAMGVLAVTALRQSRRAERQQRLAVERQRMLRRSLYASQTNLAQQALEVNNVPRALDLLTSQKPAPGEEDLRGFEWRYLWRLAHEDDSRAAIHSSGRSLAFSPDGRWLAVSGQAHTIRLYEADGRRVVGLLRGHTGTVNSLSFSADGRFMASGSDDRTVRIWELEARRDSQGTTVSGRPLALFQCPRKVFAVAITRDGHRVLAGSEDNRIRVWDRVSGRLVMMLLVPGWFPASLSLSRDGRIVASGGFRGARLWDLRTRQMAGLLEGRSGWVNTVALGPDGRTLAAAGGVVKLWDVVRRRETATLTGHVGIVDAMAFSPDGALLATGSRDNTVRLWSTDSGEERAVLRGHRGPVHALAFAPDGKTLASASDDDTIRFWPCRPTPGDYLKGRQSGVQALATTWRGNRLATGGDDGVRLWDLTTRRPVRPFPGHAAPVGFLAFSLDGRVLAAGCDDKTATVWDVPGRRKIMHIKTSNRPIFVPVDISPDGRLLAMGDAHAIRLWNLDTRREVGRLPAFRPGDWGNVNSLAFSPDGTLLASGAAGSATMKLWDVARRQLLYTFTGWLTDTSCWSWLGDCGRPFRPDRQDPSRPGERYRGRIRGRA